LKRKKIAWVADYTVKTYKAGGAQYTNDTLIKEGIKRGYNIDMLTPGIKDNGEYDLYSLHNIRNFKTEFLRNIIDNKRYMRMEHDYWVTGAFLNNKRFPDIFDKSLLNLFMSKKHLQVCTNKIGHTIPKSNYVISPIDTDLFYIGKNKIANMVVWTGHDTPVNKGFTKNVLPYVKDNPQLDFKMFGIFKEHDNTNTPDNMEIIGEVKQEIFAEYLRKAEYLMAVPNWIEPSGRSVFEGLLCGCDLIVNNNIGILHEDIDFNDYEEIKRMAHSENKFWKLVEEII